MERYGSATIEQSKMSRLLDEDHSDDDEEVPRLVEVIDCVRLTIDRLLSQ